MITTKNGMFFETKIRREGILENGTQAKLNELYVVRADSFTETEARITEYVSSFASGEFEVLTEARAKYREIFLSDKEDESIFYKAVVAFITLDEKSGKEKKSRVNYLVRADSIEAAKKHIDEAFTDSMTSYVIQSVGETSIVDIVDAETTEKQ